MVEYSLQSASLSTDDNLLFPIQLKYIPFADKVIVLSPETANWLVINNDDLPILKLLVEGERVGIVASYVHSTNDYERLKTLLAQIMARKFASTSERPTRKIDNSLKGAYFYLTNACNLHCSHCYMFSGKPSANELLESEWITLIDDFADFGGSAITFSGGEILAKRGWFRLVEHAHKKGISSTILTNGTLWTYEVIQKIAPFVAEVQISVDGPTEDINSRTRGEGAFLKAIETAKLFSSIGVRTSIAMTPTIDTVNYFEEHFLDFFQKYINGSGINIRIGHKLLSGREVNMLLDDEKLKYESITRRLSNMIYPSSEIRSFALGHQPNQVQANCGFGGVSISASGDVYPCNRISDVRSCGNVRINKISEVIPYLEELESATNVDNIEPCKWCDLRYLCGGGCRIDDYSIMDTSGNKASFIESNIDSSSSIKKKICTDEYKHSILNKLVEVKEYIFD